MLLFLLSPKLLVRGSEDPSKSNPFDCRRCLHVFWQYLGKCRDVLWNDRNRHWQLLLVQELWLQEECSTMWFGCWFGWCFILLLLRSRMLKRGWIRQVIEDINVSLLLPVPGGLICLPKVKPPAPLQYPCKWPSQRVGKVSRPPVIMPGWRSQWRLVLLNSLTCGLEICVAAGITYVPPLLLEAGVEERYMTMVLGKWLLITDLLTQVWLLF